MYLTLCYQLTFILYAILFEIVFSQQFFFPMILFPSNVVTFFPMIIFSPCLLLTAEKLLAVNTLMTMMTQNDDHLRRLDTSNTSTQSRELQRIIGCEIIQRTVRTFLANQDMKRRHLTRQQELQLKGTPLFSPSDQSCRLPI